MNTKRRHSVSGKMFVTMLAVVLLVGCIIGGTVAWLTDKTAPIKNTFTYGDINIELHETTGDSYKIVPGVNINKNPWVEVKAGSEPCYVFVKVEEKGTFVEGKVTYSISEDWIKLEGVEDVDNVWYLECDMSEEPNPISYKILAGDEQYTNGVILVSENLTKEDIAKIAENDATPTLTFTAYAVQKAGSANAAAAWEKVNP